MLQNKWMDSKSHFFLKNNMYLTNITVYKVTLFLWNNSNNLVIMSLEKFLLEYWVKNVYTSVANYNVVYGVVTLQILVLLAVSML